jgi:mono/diheme cytochrome c family protein
MSHRVFSLTFLVVILDALIGLTQTQVNKDVASRASHDYSELNKAPAKARSRLNPFQNDPDSVAAGQILFEDHCTECHGTTGEGGKKGPNLRAPEVQNATDGTLFWLLTNGVAWRGMPVWSRLPEAQRWQLVQYVKSLGIRDGLKPDPKP